ncbi:hypothetical protein ACFL7E_02185 [Thermodesulfobacteriota bacterium]
MNTSNLAEKVNKNEAKEEKPMAKIVPFKKDDIGFEYEKLDVEPIPLGAGTRVEVQLADVSLDSLRLDRNNPRINYKLISRGISNPSQKDLIDLLWEEGEVKRLKRSIQTTGGLIEAIIIQGSDGTVLEGNCRTVCFHKLQEQFPDDELWKKVRARILPPGIDRQQANILLGELHIAGKNEWRAFEQAAHLYEMNQRDFGLKDLAEMYRKSKSTIQAKIKAYTLMNEHYLPQTEADVSALDMWSYFEEFYKRVKPKADETGMEQEQDFVRWMLDGKFKKGEQVRWLPNILADEKALAKLKEEDAPAAWDIVQEESPELSSKLFKAIVTSTQILRDAPLSEVKAVKNGDAARLKKLKELQDAINTFMQQAGKKL